MLRYCFAAMVLKFFSAHAVNMHLYRRLGNILGNVNKKNMAIDAYCERGALLLDLYSKYNVIGCGSSLLELGTGWMHWYSIVTSLFHDAEITMFDVWDNRQLNALKANFKKLQAYYEAQGLRDEPAMKKLAGVCSIASFEQLYERLNLNYVINPVGDLGEFKDNQYDCVFSMHVLEHVPRQTAAGTSPREIYRLLKPGGFSIHQIGIDDHLAHYDTSVSKKNYLRYSDRNWNLMFENKVQYINRIQQFEWLDFFQKSGFRLCERIVEQVDLQGLDIAPQYKNRELDDLSCTTLTIVHQKPV